MNHVRFNIFADLLRTVLASLMVGLIWSATAMLVVLYLAHQASAEDMALEKIDKLGDAKESRLVFKTKSPE